MVNLTLEAEILCGKGVEAGEIGDFNLTRTSFQHHATLSGITL